jgi:hypothetical protein
MFNGQIKEAVLRLRGTASSQGHSGDRHRHQQNGYDFGLFVLVQGVLQIHECFKESAGPTATQSISLLLQEYADRKT